MPPQSLEARALEVDDVNRSPSVSVIKCRWRTFKTFRSVVRGWAMFTHTPVTAVQARGLLNPLIV